MNDSHEWHRRGAAASTFSDDREEDLHSVEGLLDCIESLDEDFEDPLSCGASSPSSLRSQGGCDDDIEISVIPLNDRKVFSSWSSSGPSTPGELQVERCATLSTPYPSSNFRPRVRGRATLARRVTSLGDSARSPIGEEPDLDTDPSEEDTMGKAASSGRGQTKRKKRVKCNGGIPSKSDLAWYRRFKELKGKLGSTQIKSIKRFWGIGTTRAHPHPSNGLLT